MWVVDMEKKLDGAEPPATVQKWPKHCIYRVPPRLRTSNVFRPQTVALGPFHHGNADLHPMEEHKRRAVRHLLRRSGKSLHELAVAVEDVAEQLEDAYAGLDSQWRGHNRGRFLEMMIADGCFLLEVIRETDNGGVRTCQSSQHNKNFDDYLTDDPVFGKHAVLHIAAFVHRDMLMIENQLPVILLRTIAAVESDKTPSDLEINTLVLNFLCLDYEWHADVGQELGLHPLDLYRRSLLRSSSTEQTFADQRGRHGSFCCFWKHRKALKRKAAPPLPAQKLWVAGIRFRISNTDFLDDINFRHRKLEMPRVILDDYTEYKYRNVMAFEALHTGTGNDVTAFEGILGHDLAGSDWAVVRLLNRLTKDVPMIGRSRLCGIRNDMEDYCNSNWRSSLLMAWRVFVFQSWAKLKRSHLSSPWALIALLFTLLVISTDITQTVYAVKSYAYEIWKDHREQENHR
ncbi:unnamed protein product [Urochloa decumbens]|uniref:Uncharacterized protein n=1 Tax=Urochloa decumbens TaxID=240449 RepID=A0ABC9B6K9_9POAL